MNNCKPTFAHPCIYNRLLLSHKKELNLTICSNMDGPRGIMLSEISQIKKDKSFIISICM